MLREIKAVRQDDPTQTRRWFQDDYFDLFVWVTRAGQVSAFQLGYDRSRRERALSWSTTRGFSHSRVDAGEDTPFQSRTPLLVPGGSCPVRTLLRELERRGGALEAPLRDFLLSKLRLVRRSLHESSNPDRGERRAD